LIAGFHCAPEFHRLSQVIPVSFCTEAWRRPVSNRWVFLFGTPLPAVVPAAVNRISPFGLASVFPRFTHRGIADCFPVHL